MRRGGQGGDEQKDEGRPAGKLHRRIVGRLNNWPAAAIYACAGARQQILAHVLNLLG